MIEGLSGLSGLSGLITSGGGSAPSNPFGMLQEDSVNLFLEDDSTSLDEES
jgi:hypothetical protein